jgi:hypothetical protein
MNVASSGSKHAAEAIQVEAPPPGRESTISSLPASPRATSMSGEPCAAWSVWRGARRVVEIRLASP